MPELPEVETVRQGIDPHTVGKTVRRLVVRNRRLRWPVPASIPHQLSGQVVQNLSRRGKYLLFGFPDGTMIMHLGMSGSLGILTVPVEPGRHDHVDIEFMEGHRLRFNDPRRFGLLLWTRDPVTHPLLCNLGPEPFDPGCDGRYLHARARGRRVAIKNFIMNSRIMAGIGNIYANEALFQAGIHPGRAAGRIAPARYQRLVDSIREVLSSAIAAGGTTLRNFVNPTGRPGYFRHNLEAYGRAGQPCVRCKRALSAMVIGGRATIFCASCQT